MKSKSLIVLTLLAFIAGCSAYHKYGRSNYYTVLIQRVFQGSFSTVESYLFVSPDILPKLDDATDFCCEVRETISFLSSISGIEASRSYAIAAAKLSAEDSSALAGDLARWTSWYESNRQYLSCSKNCETLVFRKGDIKRVEDLVSTRCRPVY